MTQRRCCPICAEEMTKDCNWNETVWSFYCYRCGFSEAPSIIEERWVVQALTYTNTRSCTSHKIPLWMDMAIRTSLEDACKIVDEWDLDTTVITEITGGRVWSKDLRIIRIETAIHWRHPLNAMVGDRKWESIKTGGA